ncbi:hypothetical protein ACFWDI_28300 [Streptomyces sp. NPDC060064]|uniref:hypothetical protein n=1 Tax=Streptomyces sp. NPDC060064 TaxID=3347049 RepID=UPI0036A9764A
MNGGELLHYLVRAPSGQLVDIEGARTDADVQFEYEVEADDGAVTLTDVTRGDVWAWWRDEAGEPVPMDVVRTIAATILTAA